MSKRHDPRYDELITKLRAAGIGFDQGVKDRSGRIWPVCIDGNFFIKADFEGDSFSFICEDDERFFIARIDHILDTLGFENDLQDSNH